MYFEEIIDDRDEDKKGKEDKKKELKHLMQKFEASIEHTVDLGYKILATKKLDTKDSDSIIEVMAALKAGEKFIDESLPRYSDISQRDVKKMDDAEDKFVKALWGEDYEMRKGGKKNRKKEEYEEDEKEEY